MRSGIQLNGVLIMIVALHWSMGAAALEDTDRPTQLESMNPEERAQMMRKRQARLESMSPEQREQMKRERRARMESMSPEQREQMKRDRPAGMESMSPEP